MKTLLYVLLPLIVLNSQTRCTPRSAKEEPAAVTASTGPAPAPQGTPSGETPGADSAEAIYRLVVSFYSKGEGIDYRAAEKFEAFVLGYKPAVAFEKTSWGREGEIDYCMKLSELSTKEQKQFIDLARIELANTQLVHFNENAKCVHKR